MKLAVYIGVALGLLFSGTLAYFVARFMWNLLLLNGGRFI